MMARLYKLTDVAERLGCHVETLRLRVRSGRLKAVRGPHGAYYISGRSLGDLRVGKRPVIQAGAPTAPDVEAAWRRVKTRLGRMPRAQEEVVPFLQALESEPELNRALYRLAVANGLQELGCGVNAIAGAAGDGLRRNGCGAKPAADAATASWWSGDAVLTLRPMTARPFPKFRIRVIRSVAPLVFTRASTSDCRLALNSMQVGQGRSTRVIRAQSGMASTSYSGPTTAKTST